MKETNIKDIFVQGPISSAFVAECLQQHSTKTAIGAHSMFLGQVRNEEHKGWMVRGIEYTTYQEMALEKMHEIREMMFEKYDLICMHVYHSLGFVAAGELCLFVFTSSRHRKMAIEACTELVEMIKAELPVWGKELLDDQGYVWKVNK